MHKDRIELADWQLSCYYPYVPYFNNSIEAGIVQKSLFPSIPAKVPGSVQGALLAAGILEDPYFEMNSLKAEWVEHKWWMYETSFDLPEGERWELVFEGIDYKAAVFVNGRRCGASENMFVPLVVPLEAVARAGTNELQVVLEGAPEENAQIGYASTTHTQKSRFGYKWDFCTRLVHLGLNGAAYLRRRLPAEIGELRFVGHADGRAEIAVRVRAKKSGSALLTGVLPDCEREPGRKTDGPADQSESAAKRNGRELARVERPVEIADGELVTLSHRFAGVRPWYPNGSGEQPLYDLTVTLTAAGESHARRARVGFRDIAAERNEGCPDAPYPYLFSVNGERVYLKGVNMTPLDLLYGDIPAKRYESFVRLLKEGNVNLIRVWGGGLIESEALYAAADACGILIWQEFIQSGAGIESLPSEEPSYLANLRRTAEFAAGRAIHPSLAVFSGGNELADGNRPLGFENNNLAMLREVVRERCPEVLMLPTSASGANEFLDLANLGAMHDVHGPWKFDGGADYYRLYNRSDSLLHSEFGCDGMANPEVFERCLSAENRRVSDVGENYVWRHHGEWWDTSARDRGIFGWPESLAEQIAISQFLQAEGLRYAVEANRRRAFRNSGCIVWQANEPYPNVAGTNVIDYFGRPKFAWSKLAQAYSALNPNLEYASLVREPGEDFPFRLFLTADGEETAYEVACAVEADGRTVAGQVRTVRVGGGRSVLVGEYTVRVPDCSALVVRMIATGGARRGENEVLFPVRRGRHASSQPVLEYFKTWRSY